ncbi:MAG: hypothetical protein WCR80_04050 [Bacilli bacterium]
MENANVNEVLPIQEKKRMNKLLKAILILLVIALTILVGIAIGYWLFKLVNP